MSRGIAFLIVSVLFLNVAFALTLSGELDSDVVLKEYDNTLHLTIQVGSADIGNYNLYTLSDVHLTPHENFYVNQSSFEKEFEITPMERLMDFDGSYVISYYLNQRDVKKVNDQIGIHVLSVSEIFSIDTNVIPLDAEEVTINVRNNYNVHVPNIKATFSSILFEFENEFEVLPYDNISFTVPIDNEKLRKIRAGTYLIDVDFETPKGAVSTVGVLRLSEEEGISTQKDTSGLIIRSTIINKINTGNVDRDVRVEFTRNIFTRFFTTYNTPPISEVREGFLVTYIWSGKVGPSEVYTIKTRTNYFYPFLIIVVLVVVFLFLRRVLATKLVIEKTVSPIKTKNGEFALRVYLNVTAKRTIEDVVLIDRVPKTVKIYKKFGQSTPDEIDATNRRLKWNIEGMKPGEERTFTYIVYSRVGYVGRFVLPSAAARFLLGEKVYQVESNNVFFLAEQQSSEN